LLADKIKKEKKEKAKPNQTSAEKAPDFDGYIVKSL
jgi:hypothetical protein